MIRKPYSQKTKHARSALPTAKFISSVIEEERMINIFVVWWKLTSSLIKRIKDRNSSSWGIWSWSSKKENMTARETKPKSYSEGSLAVNGNWNLSGWNYAQSVAGYIATFSFGRRMTHTAFYRSDCKNIEWRSDMKWTDGNEYFLSRLPIPWK